MINNRYKVERRRTLWAVYSPDGKKVDEFISQKKADDKAKELNKILKTK